MLGKTRILDHQLTKDNEEEILTNKYRKKKLKAISSKQVSVAVEGADSTAIATAVTTVGSAFAVETAVAHGIGLSAIQEKRSLKDEMSSPEEEEST